MHSPPLSAWTLAILVSSTSACVSIAKYRETEASLAAERTAHQKVQAERDSLVEALRQVKVELTGAQAVAKERDSAVAAGQERIAQTELDVSVVSKQREEA